MSQAIADCADSPPTAVIVFDIDGVIRDVSRSYRRAIADTVEHFTQGQYRPTLADIDALKAEGIWNNDWQASAELIQRFFARTEQPPSLPDYEAVVSFFQGKYRGDNFSGYIKDEPLLISSTYLSDLSAQGIPWGFFSGATRLSAEFVLQGRLAIADLHLVAMEDAPGKPDPTGLFQVLHKMLGIDNLATPLGYPILYVGDTVGDMKTVTAAQLAYPDQEWMAVGVIPPHVSDRGPYRQLLLSHGAAFVVDETTQLNRDRIVSRTGADLPSSS